MNFSLQFVITLTVASNALAAVLFKFISNTATERLKISWKKESEAQISTLKADLDRSNATLNSLLNLHGSNYSQSQSKKIEAIEVLWTTLIKFREVMPPFGSLVYNALTKKEIPLLWDDSKWSSVFMESRNTLRGYDRNTHIQRHLSMLGDIEKYRPFLGEDIWVTYETIRSFVGRTALLIIESVQTKKLAHWHDDPLLKDILSTILTNEELDYLYKAEIESLKLAIALLESKLLEQLNRCISGEEFTQNAFERIKNIEILFKATNGERRTNNKNAQ